MDIMPPTQSQFYLKDKGISQKTDEFKLLAINLFMKSHVQISKNVS